MLYNKPPEKLRIGKICLTYVAGVGRRLSYISQKIPITLIGLIRHAVFNKHNW